MVKKSIIRSSIIIIIITVFTKVLALVREVYTASYLGTSTISDAYLLGTTLSQIVLTGFAGNFFKTYLPVATAEKNKSDKRYAEFTSNLLMIGTGLFLVLSLVVFMSAKYSTKLLAFGASDEVVQLSIWVCKVTAFPSVCLLAINVLQGYLHVQEKFLANMVFPLVMNVSIMIGVGIGKGSIGSLSYAYGASLVLSAMCLWGYSRLSGLKRTFSKHFYKDDAVKTTLKLTLPLFLGGLVAEINEIVDRSFSAYYESGVLTALRYGKLIEIFIVSAIGISIGQAVYPRIAQLVHEKRNEDIEKLLSQITEFFCIIFIPLFWGVILVGEDLIAVIFMRGAFDATSVANTSIAFKIYSISILPVSFNEILSRVFFAFNNTKKPVLYSCIAMGLNIILNAAVVFLFKADFYMLAFTTSLSETIMALFYFVGIKRNFKLKISLSWKTIVCVFVSSGVMALGVRYIQQSLNCKVGTRLFVAVLAGVGIYVVILGLFKFSQIKAFLKKKCMERKYKG